VSISQNYLQLGCPYLFFVKLNLKWFPSKLNKMKRPVLNLIFDCLAFAGLVYLVSTGLIMRFVLPAGSGGSRGGAGMMLWGWTRHQWGEVHFWIAVGLMLVLAIHLILHWRWLVTMIRGKAKEGAGLRFGLSILAIVLMLALAVSPFLSSTQKKSPVENEGHLKPGHEKTNIPMRHQKRGKR
jgi:hypothetical protein